MKVYYVNRQDREDRNYLFRGAMAANEFPPEDLIRVIAKNREDYASRAEICDAASDDGFPGFFQRVRDIDYPGYGQIICTWSVMRAWRMIAEGDEVSVCMIDDYYIKQPKRALEFLLSPLNDLSIVQLAWHIRDDIFFMDRYNLGIPYKHVPLEVSDKSPYFYKGMWHGCSEWALVLSPKGANQLLRYMEDLSPINTEVAPTAIQHTYRDMIGTYSLRDQPERCNGTMVLRDNPWVGHLVEYTDGGVSNLMGTHDAPEVIPESKIWDERMEKPFG